MRLSGLYYKKSHSDCRIEKNQRGWGWVISYLLLDNKLSRHLVPCNRSNVLFLEFQGAGQAGLLGLPGLPYTTAPSSWVSGAGTRRWSGFSLSIWSFFLQRPNKDSFCGGHTLPTGPAPISKFSSCLSLYNVCLCPIGQGKSEAPSQSQCGRRG